MADSTLIATLLADSVLADLATMHPKPTTTLHLMGQETPTLEDEEEGTASEADAVEATEEVPT
jgi:hypothetical protein